MLGSGRAPGLRFVRLRPPRLERTIHLDGFVSVVAWVAPRRVLVVTAGRCCPAPLRALGRGGVQVRWPYAYRGLDDGYRPHRADVIDLRTGRLTRARVPGWVALFEDEERLCWC